MNRFGILVALLSALLFGISTPLAKLLLGEIDPWVLAGLLYLGSGIGLAIFLVLRHGFGYAAMTPIARSDLPWLAGAIVAGGVAGPVLLMIGLAGTSGSATSLLLNLEGLATMAIAWIVFRENVDRRLLAGAAAILAGAVVLSWSNRGVAGVFAPGALAIAGACLAWGIDNNLTRKVSAGDSVQIAAIKGLVAGPINLAIALTKGAHLPALPAVAAAGFVGLVGYGVSLSLFVLALRHLGSARTGAYFSTAPFVGAMLSVMLLHDPVTSALGISAILMMIGVWLHMSERHEHAHTHEATEHAHSHRHDAHHQHVHGPDDPPGEPHAHAHRHEPLTHNHPHYPDLHHRHTH